MESLIIYVQMGQAHWASTGPVRKSTALARCGTACLVPVPGPARHRARVWAASPGCSAGPGTSRFLGRHDAARLFPIVGSSFDEYQPLDETLGLKLIPHTSEFPSSFPHPARFLQLRHARGTRLRSRPPLPASSLPGRRSLFPIPSQDALPVPHPLPQQPHGLLPCSGSRGGGET